MTWTWFVIIREDSGFPINIFSEKERAETYAKVNRSPEHPYKCIEVKCECGGYIPPYLRK